MKMKEETMLSSFQCMQEEVTTANSEKQVKEMLIGVTIEEQFWFEWEEFGPMYVGLGALWHPQF